MKIEDIEEISDFFNTSLLFVSNGDTENLIPSYYSEQQQVAIISSIVESVIESFAPTGTSAVMRSDVGVERENGLTEVPIINYRFHFVFEEFTPEIYEFTVDMLRINPKLSVLTYNGGGEHAVKNRNLALKNYKKTPAGTNRSWD